MSRRDFLRKAGLAGLGMALLGADACKTNEPNTPPSTPVPAGATASLTASIPANNTVQPTSSVSGSSTKPVTPPPTVAPTAPPSISIPPEIMARLPPAIARQIEAQGFYSLTPDEQAKILQLMAAPSPKPVPTASTAGGNLPPTGGNYKMLVPINDLGTGSYHGYEGGLYAGGGNIPSRDYLAIGMTSSAGVRPLSAGGQPDSAGQIVLLTVGFSNTNMESEAFIGVANSDPLKNPRVKVVNGAVGGRDALELANPSMTRYWDELRGRLDSAGVTAAQVQAIWLKEVVAGDTLPFPSDAERFRDALAAIVERLRATFANLRLIYGSSRTYGGYALQHGSQEPWAYEGAFAYKWMIENWQAGPTPGSPWVAWGPYLWANGSTPRSDGLAWDLDDFQTSDQMHPNASGTAKVATLLSGFFKTDPTARSWYLKG